MSTENQIIKNYGIIASISWNSNNWTDEPSESDLKQSKYYSVKENKHMHESLNFGHNIYPSEEDGYYIGYTPMFNRLPKPENSKYVSIIFFVSSDYMNSNRKAIVGFYGFPEFGELYARTPKHKMFTIYNSGNVKSRPEDIIYFDNPIIINNEIAIENELLPSGRMISMQGFNYLNSDNVYNLMVLALRQNTQNNKLRSFVERFPLMIELTKEEFDLQDFIQVIGDTTADSLNEINELERRMKKQPPEIKHRISAYIERGAIANKIKKLTGYKCLICEAKDLTPFSFKKSNGIYYVETHHVEPVSTLKVGVLGISNLLTVCANHHRQLHYGNSVLVDQTERIFVFEIDGERLSIPKINFS